MMIWSIDPNWIIKKGAGVVRFFPSCLGMMLIEGTAKTNPPTADMG